MIREPLPGASAAEIKAFYADKNTCQDLADAFAIVHNKCVWVNDNVYDYEVSSPEYAIACAIADEWNDLQNQYRDKIFEILKMEGIIIPEAGYVKTIEPYMARYGYINGNGWWIKEQQSDCVILDSE
ncbi:MAG: hypothetical protein IIX77_00140 [Oscillospiraceae bacterium]|nr:hypothetical protein [Oscillospiraceae bacterium]